jgi:hypothetical protein
MTIDAEFAAPLADPMHTLLDNALTPYLDGDLDASDDLIDTLLDLIASAERTPELVRTLHTAIKTLPPSRDLMPAMHAAIGAALELDTPAPASNGYGNTGASRTTARAATAHTGSGASREGSIGARIKGIFTNNPGKAYRVGDLVKALSTMGYDHSGGAVGAALNGMTDRGEAALVGDKPKLYLAADDPAAPTQAPDTTPDQADDAPVTAPATDTATDTAAEPADAGKTPAPRRAAAKK